MRIALIADIHGNLPALQATLERLMRMDVAHIICLGDVAATGPQPHECLRLLRETECPVVMGNVDALLLEPPPPPTDETNAAFYEIDLWAAEQVTEDDLAYVATFEPTIRVSDGLEMLCYHGSPHSYDDEIHAETPTAHLEAYFGTPDVAIYAGGHTHQAFLRRYRNAWVVNPGSVGLGYALTADGQGATNPPQAAFALIEMRRKQPQFTFHRVPYDVGAYIDAAYERGMPHAEWFLSGR